MSIRVNLLPRSSSFRMIFNFSFENHIINCKKNATSIALTTVVHFTFKRNHLYVYCMGPKKSTFKFLSAVFLHIEIITKAHFTRFRAI